MSEQKVEKSGSSIGETVSIIIQALLLAIVLRTVVFQPFSIPSGSMKPTLLVGDYLFVSKFSYGYSKHSIPFSPDLFEGRIWEGKPERGDIAVFKYPPNPDIDYIKRVIGLPGDKIQMRDGALYINGEKVERKPASNFLDDESGAPPVRAYIETLPNGVSYTTLDINPNSLGDNTREFTVPANHYFMMGDNRDNSADSRFEAGFVPFENFVGKATVIFFSIKNNSHPLAIWKWPQDARFSRFFEGL
ncbi:MAG: signal peptidase I [Rhizobiaceae bacterium]|nr:signal peptidase I [Rhizobiaceae bacterium]